MEKTEQELYADYQSEIVNCARLEEKLLLVKIYGLEHTWDKAKCEALVPSIEADLLISRQSILTKQNLYILKYGSLVA
jgi:hypothetical protein